MFISVHRSIIMKYIKMIFGYSSSKYNIAKIKYLLICTTQKNFILSLKWQIMTIFGSLPKFLCSNLTTFMGLSHIRVQGDKIAKKNPDLRLRLISKPQTYYSIFCLKMFFETVPKPLLESVKTQPPQPPTFLTNRSSLLQIPTTEKDLCET